MVKIRTCDELISMESGKNYGVRVRKSNGETEIFYLVHNGESSKSMTLQDPIASENAPKSGDLFAFGETSGVNLDDAIDLIITDIQCGENLSAELTCVEYSPEIFGIDDPNFVLPDFDNKLSETDGIVDAGEVSGWRTWTTFHDDAEKPDTPTGDGTENGWHIYWLGDTPDTAQDAEQTLVCLKVNETTDEVDAFRTSKAMIEAGDADVDVSLYIFRDSKSDRRGEEKYNIIFYDTPAGEKSLVKVITDVLEERELEMPRPIRIVLRGFDIGGADLPVYSLTDHFFAMCDGTDGEVRMFDGFYNATFDGDTFESDYTKIEGILNNDLTITIKKGQPIWPEWTGDNTAEDIQGNEYVRVNDEWYLAEEAPRQELNEDAVAA